MKALGVVLMIIAASFAAISSAEARGGCGIGWHRGPGGGCYRNGGPAIIVRHPVVVAPAGSAAVIVVPPGRACPIGYHLGPHGHHCFRN